MYGLKLRRLERKLTQSDLAKILGLKTNTLCQYEKNRREPGLEILKKMAEFFDCTIDELM